MTQSEESMILMTSYHFPPTVTDPSLSLQDDVLWSSSSQQQVFDIASG